MTESLMQAYSNSPRRKKLQILGGILLVLVIFAVLLVSHLIVSAKVVAAGRQLQTAKNTIDRLEYTNVNYSHQIAQLSRIAVMEKKAREMGFRPPYPGESFFISVPGLENEPPVVMNTEPEGFGVDVDVNRPAYHQTLWEWFRVQFSLFFSPLGEL